MKYCWLPFLAFFSALGWVHFSSEKNPRSVIQSDRPDLPVASCSPDWKTLHDYLEESDIPPLPGAGSYQWNIATQNDSARFYFNQGINLYYGFHIIESLASFKKATRFDPAHPMTWWAQALAYGPNINDAAYAASPAALDAIRKAAALSGQATLFEKSLIQAMLTRYSADSMAERSVLNSHYTKAMEKVYLANSSNADAAALYADAIMLEHPWELWKVGGNPWPWTPRIRQVLERALRQTPLHPGINHYYIHVMEPSPFPQKALPSADRLGKLSPGVSHLVHMPSHIYLRTGNYQRGTQVNEAAVQQYTNYLRLFPAVAASEGLYRMHNEHMLVNCALHAGKKNLAIGWALSLQKSIDTAYLSDPSGAGNYMQYMYMVPVLAMIRFEDWDGLLAAASPAENHVYALLLWHFGRGMAYQAQNDNRAAVVELDRMETLLKDRSLYRPFPPFSLAAEGAKVALHLLKGTIAMGQKNTKDAIAGFRQAVELERKMVYNEPRDWLLNPKNYLANACLTAGLMAQAEQYFREDLNDNNENGWSLSGLYKVLQQQKKKKEAASVLERLKIAAAGSDINFIQ